MRRAKISLQAIGIIYLINALVMWFWPMLWYDQVPGISMMGPFNLHFVRDIALIYGVSGYALFVAARARDVNWFGAIWPAMHAVFHLWIWMDRGFALDLVFATNLLGIQLPAWLAVWAIAKLRKG